MAAPRYTFRSKVVVYAGLGAWRFISLPPQEGKEVKEKYGAHAKGWGSLKVSATIGKTTWETSIFPDKKSASYLLPLKASVRKAEGIQDGAVVTCTLFVR
jgi:Domain of unknown function (DUF1905)